MKEWYTAILTIQTYIIDTLTKILTYCVVPSIMGE